MPATPGFAFATIGINHGHDRNRREVTIDAGRRLKSFFAIEVAAVDPEAVPEAERIRGTRPDGVQR